MDKLTVTFTRPTCMVLDMLFESYMDGFFKFILNYTGGMDGLNKKRDEACEKIEEAVSELEASICVYLKESELYYGDFCMDIDKWDRVVVFLRNLNYHTVALLVSAGHNCIVPTPLVREYLDIVQVAYRIIMDRRETVR